MPSPLRRLLAATLLLGPLVSLGLPSPATGADVTCQGRAATIVGTPGGSAVGTADNDVIVSNGAMYVDGGEGDDLICTTNTRPYKRRVLSVSGGTGSNVIDRRGDLDPAVGAMSWLGGQSETFLGGPGPDQVSIERPDAGATSVSTGGGDDSVFVDHLAQLADPSRIETGVGADMVSVTNTVTNLEVTDEDGDATLALSDVSPGVWEVDAAAGSATFDPDHQLTFRGFDAFSFLLGPRARVRFQGSPRSEAVSLEGRGQVRVARMGRGDDVVRFHRFTKPRTRLKGGPGQDRLEVIADRESNVRVDLPDQWFSARGRHRSPLKQFEDVTAEGAVVDILGDRRGNRLEWWGCDGGTVAGGGGADIIAPVPPNRGCSKVQFRALGGPGSDRLTGSRSRDLLDGGPGRDRADGGPGTDTCPAIELPRACERT